ncbi:MAG: cupin domain-containing protein [Planctomycetota bacterium]|nr:MAG: cupin domain-containing protein [Planctomycetota bacterium]
MKRLFLLPFLAAACQSAPPAEFHYVNTEAWRQAHPQGTPGMQSSEAWPAPASDGRLLVVRGEVRLHYHAGREEWLYVLDGSGTFQVGPAAAEFVPPEQMTSYPVARGDLFLIPRRTAHSFRGAATLLVVYSPGMPEEPDRVEAPDQSSAEPPAGTSASISWSSTRKR